MDNPPPYATSEVQQVWEIVLDDGSVWTHNEELTAEAAVAKARANLERSIAQAQEFGDYNATADLSAIRFAKVRQRTSVSTQVYVTKYAHEQDIASTEAMHS